MLLALWLFWALAALELLIDLVPVRRGRIVGASILIPPILGVGAAIMALHPSIPAALVFVMSLYRGFNLLRLVKGRVNEKYLHRSSVQASLWLIGMQAVVIGLWLANQRLNIPTGHIWLAIGYVDLLGTGVLLASTLRHVWKTRPPRLDNYFIADADLPTLTVAIPARNETEELEDCLSSLVASDYPKLEVLVLDDCSQNKRTPEIIRSYAHAGIRFLAGTPPEDNWLAKNHAYQQLFEAANGDLILFCGVDARFNTESLRRLVTVMLQKRKTMMSIIPRNVVPTAGSARRSTLVQPMRYAWELSLPRRLFRRPPVLSTCWLIKRELIASAGGFGAVSRSVVPESYFARVSAVHDGYSFMQSDSRMGIISNKLFSEQGATAIRTRYPQVHRRIELAFLLSAAELGCVLLPYVLLAFGLLRLIPAQLTIISGVSVLLLTAAFAAVMAVTYRRWLTRSLILLPAAAVLDVIFMNDSMVRYEFFTVTWKGRNVCIPVMRVVEHLPKQ